MAISDKTRKILWARSGDRCAECRRQLVEEATRADAESVISLFRNGPIRYAEMAPPRIAGHPAESAGGLDGAENEGGAIRTDTSGIRVRHRDGKGRSAQARGASADGAPGAKGCATASTQASTAAAAG